MAVQSSLSQWSGGQAGAEQGPAPASSGTEAIWKLTKRTLPCLPAEIQVKECLGSQET